MDTSVTDGGLLGAILIALVVYAVTKKSSFNLPDFTKAGTSVADTLGKVYGKLLFFIAGVAALYWGSGIKVRPAEFGVWGQEYWLQILIVYGIGAGFIWLNAEEKTAKTLQKVLAGVVFMTLIGFPMWSWIASPSDTSPHVDSQFKPPLTSLPKAVWPKMVVPAGGNVHIPVPPYMHVDVIGDGVTLYNVYRDGRECKFGESCTDGPLTSVRIANATNQEIIISYAFAM